MPTTDTGIHYELRGTGTPLLLGFPVLASHAAVTGDEALLDGFLEHLVDRYQVLVIDYPSIGASADIPPEELTVDRAAADLLAVADAAGFDRFAWWGYAWGAIMGLQLASRTDRITALACGGWPPLGGNYAGMLAATTRSMAQPSPSAMTVLRSPEQYGQWVTFYRSMQGWNEAEAVASISCPRLAFAGADGDVEAAGVPIRNASTLRAYQKQLQGQGWQVRLVAGQGHGLGLTPALAAPMLREFLDGVTAGVAG